MQELMELLEKVQQAYSERNTETAEEFLDDVFVKDDPVYFGTSPAEQCVGKVRILRQICYDWTVWGELRLDFDSLIAHTYGNSADFMITGYVDWNIPEDRFLSRAVMDVKDMVLRGGNDRELLYTLGSMSSKYLMEASRGERHLLPLRMSGMMVREEEKLKISHVHLSYPTQCYPDCRMCE